MGKASQGLRTCRRLRFNHTDCRRRVIASEFSNHLSVETQRRLSIAALKLPAGASISEHRGLLNSQVSRCQRFLGHLVWEKGPDASPPPRLFKRFVDQDRAKGCHQCKRGRGSAPAKATITQISPACSEAGELRGDDN